MNGNGNGIQKMGKTISNAKSSPSYAAGLTMSKITGLQYSSTLQMTE